jgi:hypothetical protein
VARPGAGQACLVAGAEFSAECRPMLVSPPFGQQVLDYCREAGSQ